MAPWQEREIYRIQSNPRNSIQFRTVSTAPAGTSFHAEDDLRLRRPGIDKKEGDASRVALRSQRVSFDYGFGCAVRSVLGRGAGAAAGAAAGVLDPDVDEPEEEPDEDGFARSLPARSGEELDWPCV